MSGYASQIDVAPIDWTEQDARETISHLGYYEMAEEVGLRRILSLPERDRLRSARTYMAGLDAGGESGIRFLLDGLGVESLWQLGAILEAARAVDAGWHGGGGISTVLLEGLARALRSELPAGGGA